MVSTRPLVDFRRTWWRRGTPAEWTIKNPVLGPGEPGVELITGDYRIGDGVRRWNDLPVYRDWESTQAYIDAEIASLPPGGGTSDITQQDLTDHVNSATPHPVYDDGVSLVLLYNNAKV